MTNKYSKVELLKALEGLIKMTRAGEELSSLSLSDDEENVIITWKSGSTTNVVVGADSGISIIRDVTRKIN